jgi:hypothetical protein
VRSLGFIHLTANGVLQSSALTLASNSGVNVRSLSTSSSAYRRLAVPEAYQLWKFVEEFKQLNKPNMNIEVWDIYGARVVICLGAINFMYRTDPDTRYKERYHQQTLKNEAGFD